MSEASGNVELALDRFARAIGRGNMTRDAAALAAAGTATFATEARVLAILRPADRDEVRACLTIAHDCGVPVYPVSSGKNWGYGSRVPVRDGVLLDLTRLNRIRAFDEELAYVTVEPGVTQRQLQEFLRERGSKLWMDATGASPECSIVGNTMERGFGHTPMGDHCGNACGLEVVLPTGDLISTGMGRFAGAKTTALNRWGLGPSLDGLFSQSNLGVVTAMSVWLMPAPERFQAFFFATRDADGIGTIVEALRPLRMNGTLRSTIHIGNDYKVLAAATQYPWDQVPHGPLDQQTIASIRQRMAFGTWNGSGGLYGTPAQVREARRQVKRALAGKVDRLQFVDDRLLGIMRRLSTPFRVLTRWDVSKTLAVIAPVYNLMKGVPTDSTLASAYWRKRGAPPPQMDPDRDGCGLLWCSPVVPNRKADVLEVTGLATTMLLAHGFEPQMSLSLVSERNAICVTTISYDRAVPGEDARAMRCYHELTQALIDRGYPPYRLNVESMAFATGDAGYAALTRTIKQALDPRHVLAPGRYDASPRSGAAVGDATEVAVAGEGRR